MSEDSRREVRTGLDRCLARLWRYALVLTGRSDTAEDLVQATCLRAVERADQFVPGMIREALVNDAALFVGWKMRGVLPPRPVARRCHHLFDGLPLDEGSAHELRKNRFQQRPPASGPAFRVDRQRDRILREFDGAKHDGAVIHRRAEGLGIGRLSLCELPVRRLLPDPVPEGVALLP